MTEFSKEERLAEVWKRLAAAPVSCSHDEAHQLLSDVIREVEDELTEFARTARSRFAMRREPSYSRSPAPMEQALSWLDDRQMGR